jgi:hypothetical protein
MSLTIIHVSLPDQTGPAPVERGCEVRTGAFPAAPRGGGRKRHDHMKPGITSY